MTTFLAALGLIAGASGCGGDPDCSGAGACSSGHCICDPAWLGENCTELALLPALSGAALRRNASSSWGGSVIVDPHNASVHHMFAADMALHCGLNSWQHNSQVVRAVSTTGPEGPFELVDTDPVVPIFGHNPTVHKTIDGYHVVMHIGSGKPSSGREPYADCSNGTTPDGLAEEAEVEQVDATTAGAPSTVVPNMVYSKSLEGPWTRPASNGGSCNNPAAHFFNNGTVLLICKMSFIPKEKPWRQMVVYTADDWRGPYVLRAVTPVFGEDAFVWQGPRAFHMLLHAMYPRKTPTTAWSPDGINWIPNGYAGPDRGPPAPRLSFGHSVMLKSGGQFTVARRERHQVLVDPETREPVALYNGCTLPGELDFSFTAVQPIGRSSSFVLV